MALTASIQVGPAGSVSVSNMGEAGGSLSWCVPRRNWVA